MIAGAILFYKERTIFVDLSYHLFEICRSGDFVPNNFRFVSVATQLFPYMGVQWDLPLQQVLLLYSIGFAILYTGVYLVAGALQSYRIALCFLLIHSLFISHTFYWTQSELPQGLAFMMLSFALIEYNPQNQWKLMLKRATLPFFLFTAAFAHPLLLFPFCFISIFLFIGPVEQEKRRELLSCSIMYLLFYASRIIFFKAAYEHQAFEGLNYFTTRLPDFFKLHSTLSFFKKCTGIYVLLPIGFIVVNAFYVIDRKLFKALLFSAFSLGYLVLINVSYPEPHTQAFYIENLYIPLGVFLAFPLVYDVLPSFRQGKVYHVSVGLILLFAAARIFTQHKMYRNRLSWLERTYRKHQNEKVILHTQNVPIDTALMTWGSAYEFWLLSTIQTNRSASLLISEAPDQFNWALGTRDIFLTAWGAFPYSSLPPRYFHFSDTSNAYKRVKPGK